MRQTKRDADWPRYMELRRLKGGIAGYYWCPPSRDRKANCPVHGEALGRIYAEACDRARLLNAHLDSWREGRGVPKPPDAVHVGTIDWWFEEYMRSEAWKTKVSERSQIEYREVIKRLTNIATELREIDGTPVPLGKLPVSSLSHAAVDKIYAKLRKGGAVTRRANMAVEVARRAWKVVARAHPGIFLIPVQTAEGRRMAPINPFVDLEKIKPKKGGIVPATRDETFALADALDAMNHRGLAVAALIAFEWLQRPENILAGHITWNDYRPAERPNEVCVFHHKTNERVWLPLEERLSDGTRRLLYPELETRLKVLPRLGTPIVLMRPYRTRPATPYDNKESSRHVRRARRAAGLGEHVTLTACRHGGMTLLGDAELTEQQTMALSGHTTPAAARGYVKRTQKQRASAASRRRDFIDEGG
jgi:hypothetical protein